MKNETLATYLRNAELAKLVDHYLASKNNEKESNATTLYPIFAERLCSQRFILPLTGVQGSGKSTLLNALAFDDTVMPIEADETTCVPVEIVWSSNPSKEARILFSDKREERIPANEEKLALFVNNNYNPGNEKGVDRVILESDCDILKTGIVLVDLPGVGSLTTRNVETTKKYLDESIGVMFLLRTIPTLTKSDSIFISFQWVRFQMAIFIQNWWQGETPETLIQVKEARDYNTKVLKDIARSCRIKLNGDPEIYVVNAYGAYKGALEKDAAMINKSGIQALMKELKHLAKTWPITLQETYKTVLLNNLRETLDEIGHRLKELSEDTKTLNEKIESEQSRFDKYITEIKGRFEKVKKDADNFLQEQTSVLNAWKNKAAENLRNNMRTKMRAGIVDGPRLERAIKDEETVVFEEIFACVQESIFSFHDKIREKLDDIPAWKSQKESKIHTVRKPEARKYETLAPTVLSSGGGIAGGLAGGVAGATLAVKTGTVTAAAAAKIGAALGMGAGPVGAAVGAVVGGVVGVLAGYFIGKKAKEKVTENRGEKVKEQVFNAIQLFTDETATDLKKDIKEFIDKIIECINAFQAQQILHFEEDKKRKVQTLNQSVEEKEKHKESLRSDLKRVNEYLSDIEKENSL